ncbi:hypothetical protein MJO28_002564 [Puccinia striiformis f. sp. tritici]|uniref:Uncharacterized protein n=1 Tax=Puccinia striiformis f. sp. tritici TaxID=168172 RepID=A0ACC0ERQ0_9BASI|nr:hypothetical protein MJO28_002564 [Puccinia striiformis f. sp. tritici]
MSTSERNTADIVVIEDDREKEINDTASDSVSTDTVPNSSAESGTDSVAVDVETESDCQAKKRKLTSKVWDHFERITEGNVVKAICNYCRSSLSAMQGILSFSGRAPAVWIFSQEETRKKLAEMVIRQEYSFSTVEHEGFIEFMKVAQPKFVIPGRLTVRNDCVKIYEMLKSVEKVKMSKADHIGITTDLWTSSDLTGYMVVTAHYITREWGLTKTIISFRPLLSPHTGQVIADRLSQVLIEWKALQKLAFVTLDNASSNNLAVSRLQRFISDRSSLTDRPATSRYFHVRCLAHVINLVVKDGLKQISSALEHLRESVKYIHGSSSRIEAFDRALVASNIDPKKKHPSKDVPTQWNATYLMLESSIPLKTAFQQLGMDDEKYEVCPSVLDWEELAIMKDFLEPFYTATLDLSGTQYPTMNLLYRAMRKIEKRLNDSSNLKDSHLSRIVNPMKDKFTKYWQPMQDLEETHTAQETSDFLGKVRAAILSLWAMCAPAQKTANSPPKTSSSTSKKVDEETSRFLQYMNGSIEGNSSNAPSAKLDLYLEERNIGITAGEQFDILVASESAFSTGGRVLDDYRTRLNEETVEALLCAQDWIKNK